MDLLFGSGLCLADGVGKCGVDTSLDAFVFVFKVGLEVVCFVFFPPGIDFLLCHLWVCIDVVYHEVFCLEHDVIRFGFDFGDCVVDGILGVLFDGFGYA